LKPTKLDQVDESGRTNPKEERATEWKTAKWCKNIRANQEGSTGTKDTTIGMRKRKRKRKRVWHRAKEFEKTLVYPGRQRDEDDSLDGSIRGNSPSSRSAREGQPKRLNYCPENLQKPADREDVRDVTTANFSLNPKEIRHGEKVCRRTESPTLLGNTTTGMEKLKSQDEHCTCRCYDKNQI
jgi:hypothetical protein